MTSYYGGKSRTGKRLAAVILATEQKWCKKRKLSCPRPYLEPFCGMCGVLRHIPPDRDRFAGDAQPDLIMMWQKLQSGWKPSARIVSKATFKRLHKSTRPSAERGFVGHAYGFNGLFFAPYPTTPALVRDKARRGRNGVIAVSDKVRDVTFDHASYDQWDPRGFVIYCDPPYSNTAYTGRAKQFKGSFDHKEFWAWANRMVRNGNLVFVSEKTAPKGWVSIYSTKATRQFNQRKGAAALISFDDHLFVHRSARLH